jgi:deoxyadenosine/deoxycytidine kinase
MIAVEGNIGAGKSTLLEAIESWFPSGTAVVVPEPIGVWTTPLPGQTASPLGKFYSDSAKNALAFQVLVASSKVRDLGAKLGAPGAVAFCERDPFDVDIFPRLNLEESLFDEFHLGVMGHLLETLSETSGIPSVSGSIYLRADPGICFERVTTRGRSEEGSGGVDIDKLRRIHVLHEKKFGAVGRAGAAPVLILDASAPVDSHRGDVIAFARRVSRAHGLRIAPARKSSGGSQGG